MGTVTSVDTLEPSSTLLGSGDTNFSAPLPGALFWCRGLFALGSKPFAKLAQLGKIANIKRAPFTFG